SSRGPFPFIVAGPRQVGGFYDSYFPGQGKSLNTAYGGSLTAQFDVGWAQLLSITAQRNAPNQTGSPDPFDYPFLPATPTVGQLLALRTVNLYSRFSKTNTQEFQLLSPDSSKIKWVGGVFLLDDVAGVYDKHDIRLAAGGL